MNEHFRAASDVFEDGREPQRVVIPKRGYGRVDHVERNPSRPHTVLVAIDIVDADWLDMQGQYDDKFIVHDDMRRMVAWKHFKNGKANKAKLSNPFENAPLFRLEIELPLNPPSFGLPPPPQFDGMMSDASLARLETQWIEFDNITKAADPTAENLGFLYSGLFSEPIPVTVEGRIPSPQDAAALSDIFSLAHLPEANTSDVERVLSNVDSDYLAAYDVGQGNANALLSSGYQAMLYFDLGAGVYRNRHTTPTGLRFCLSSNPKIILSHWDADHWAGAYATSVGGSYPALKMEWIAPLQVVGPLHVAFAYDIATSGGNLYIYSPPPGTVGRTRTTSGHLISFTTGKGSTRNASGIVLSVENSNLPSGPGSWLLTGDCDYKYFIASLNPAPSIGLVVPHHGADIDSSTYPTPTVSQHYRRIVYSFGKDNAHGKTSVQHPTSNGIAIHAAIGWAHGTWMSSAMKPCATLPGGDALATCEHSPGSYRGGVIIGWDGAPSPCGIPCGGRDCSAALIQS